MAWKPIRAGRDHLQQYGKQPAVEAVAELIWNSLDAEADQVDVEVESASIGTDERALLHVTRIAVSDNGHGITPDLAEAAFLSLGDSWKKRLNGRTLNNKRALHGNRGRGRFFVYALGHRATWSSVAMVDDKPTLIEIRGDQGKIDGFMIGEPKTTTGPLGTTVTIAVEQGRSLTSLLRDDLHQQLAARLAPHLLANVDIAVTVNGQRLNPAALVDGEPTEIELDIAQAHLGGREAPVLTIVDWTDEMRPAPGIVLCNTNGTALIEIGKSAPAPVKSTGYLKWSGFSDTAQDLILAELQHSEIITSAVKTLDQHIKQRTGTVTTTIIKRLKDEKVYPYAEELNDPIQQTERDLFDLVAVTVRSTLNAGNRAQRAMSARLLKLALEERPESLDTLLAEALDLAPADRELLTDLLRVSPLGKIIGAASEVTRRVDLLTALRHLLYSPGISNRMREVDQLHPLVKDSAWLFGESWRLSRSETSLTNVLRAVADDDTLLEAELAANDGKVLADGKQGRVDLLLQRTIRSPGHQHRLIVELKRPSVRLRNTELAQIRRYASALSGHAGVGPSKWTFWLVGASTHPEIDGQLKQRDRAWGHIESGDDYDIYVTTWGSLIDEAEGRLAFYRDQLTYDITQGEAADRVRARHAELLPPEQSQKAGDPAA